MDPIEIQPVTLAEALAAYHEAGEIEAFQCIHVPAGKSKEAEEDQKPIAIEFDQKIYVRIDGVLRGLDWIGSTHERTTFSGRDARVEVSVLGRATASAYGESDNRMMRLKVFSGGTGVSFKTFGVACGI